MEKRRQQLESAFESFKRIPFPDGTESEELGRIRMDLAAFDSGAAGLVSTFLSGGAVSLDALTPREDLASRLEELISHADGKTAKDAQGYLAYLRSLDELLAEVKSIVENPLP